MKRIAVLLCCLLPALAFGAGQRFISIGTGGLTGVYYPAGGAICRLLNKERRTHGIRCSVESTGGSIFNLNALASGELDFGVAQSDWQYYAYEGSAKFSEQGPNRDLRAVFSIHSELFSVMARDDSGIASFSDLRGKRVNIGNPGSGQRGTMEVLMQTLGWRKADFKLVSELKANEQARALCDNKIDAMIYAVGHPNASIKEASTACEAHLVPVTGKAVETLVAAHPYYAVAQVPGGLYRGSDEATPTFGVKATLVTRAQVDESVVYELVKAVFENLDNFRQLHPAFEHLQAADMLKGNSAPFHPGAIKYYREAGLM
ncbi:MAG: TAXI family TRAP transporter solute-binding subunit [Candidatus Thiodiazotropha sp.]